MFMQKIKQIIFGVRAKGESLPIPTLKTTECTNRPSEDQWMKDVKFGSRYGHKGSFYNRN